MSLIFFMIRHAVFRASTRFEHSRYIQRLCTPILWDLRGLHAILSRVPQNATIFPLFVTRSDRPMIFHRFLHAVLSAKFTFVTPLIARRNYRPFYAPQESSRSYSPWKTLRDALRVNLSGRHYRALKHTVTRRFIILEPSTRPPRRLRHRISNNSRSSCAITLSRVCGIALLAPRNAGSSRRSVMELCLLRYVDPWTDFVENKR